MTSSNTEVMTNGSGEFITGCNDVKSVQKFYDDGANYWKTIPADVNGMLGGFSHISSIDISGSRNFLNNFIVKGQPSLSLTNRKRALDCGAGIGRISKLLLLPLFDKVDLLELNENFLKKTKEYVGPKLSGKIGDLICCGMQVANFQENYYDVIWIQWVTGHLIDEHFVKFLKMCKKALTPNGVIIIKDNLTVGGIELDTVDSSVTRSEGALKGICAASGLNIVKETRQNNFPACLYAVIILALR